MAQSKNKAKAPGNNAQAPGEVPPNEADTANTDPKRTNPEGASKTRTSSTAQKPTGSQNNSGGENKKGSGGMKYFRSRMHGLSIVVKNDREDADPTTAIETVRFKPYREKFQGDDIKVGYLATNNPEALKRLKDDPNVEEISADEFKKSTPVKNRTGY